MEIPEAWEGTAMAIRPIADVATELGVHPRTIRRWGASGLITLYRVGPRLLRVDEDQVAALIRPIPTVRASA